jgi:hypothetical protein
MGAGIAFLRESTPAQRRQRYGDADYDWDFRVDTTSGTVGWRDRLMGALTSPYQPTEPALFREMMTALGENGADFSRLTFIDLGSGKGRTLLMASDYPFRRIVGVELLPELHRIAEENIRAYRSGSQRCFAIAAVCQDATQVELPAEPTLLYLFNPLPEAGLWQLMQNLEVSLRAHRREFYLLYHNPLLEPVVAANPVLQKMGGTRQYTVYARRGDV